MTGTMQRDKAVDSGHHIFTDKRVPGGDAGCFRCDLRAEWRRKSDRDAGRQVDFTLDFGFDSSTRGPTFDISAPEEWTSGEWSELGDTLEIMVETRYSGRDRSVEVHWRAKGEAEEHRLLYRAIPATLNGTPDESIEVTLDGRFVILWMLAPDSKE